MSAPSLFHFARNSVRAGTALGLALALLAGAASAETPAVARGAADLFSARVVTTGLSAPWALLRGDDGNLWVAERASAEITAVDAYTGDQSLLLTLPEAIGQGGIGGISLDAQFGTGAGQDFLYVSYGMAGADGTPRQALARYRYNAALGVLEMPQILLAGLPASEGVGRVATGPDGQIYWLIGGESSALPTADQILAGDFSTYAGRILRLTPEGGIPADNPDFGGLRSHIFAAARHLQDLAFGPTGALLGAPDAGDVTAASAAYYGGASIAPFANALLAPLPESGGVLVQKLGADGTSAAGAPEIWLESQNRYRDLAISADGMTLYLTTDEAGEVITPDGRRTGILHHPGAILAFTYKGPQMAIADMPPAEVPVTLAAYVEAGAGDYLSKCAACHGMTGEGGIGPRLDGNANLGRTGYVEDVLVNGFGYMPAFGSSMDDYEMAQLATYIGNVWGNSFGLITAEEIAEVR